MREYVRKIEIGRRRNGMSGSVRQNDKIKGYVGIKSEEVGRE